VSFDGYGNGTLLEAKGPGYARLIDNPSTAFSVADKLEAQALRQLRVAQGVPIEWHVAEQEFAEGLRNLFNSKAINIKVVHTPIAP